MEYYAGESIIPGGGYMITADSTPATGGTYPVVSGNRLQLDMYVCAPWGDYELIVTTTSTNNGNPMEYVAWEVENGPDQVLQCWAVPCRSVSCHTVSCRAPCRSPTRRIPPALCCVPTR